MKNFKANISLEEFSRRLDHNVVKGWPWILFTPFSIFNIFSSSRKYFFGTFDNGRFSVTRNSFFRPAPFVVKGYYDLAEDGDSADVSYRIQPIILPYYGLRLVSVLILIMLVRDTVVVEEVNRDYQFLAIGGTMLIVFNLVLFAFFKRQREELEEIFRSIFVFT